MFKKNSQNCNAGEYFLLKNKNNNNDFTNNYSKLKDKLVDYEFKKVIQKLALILPKPKRMTISSLGFGH